MSNRGARIKFRGGSDIDTATASRNGQYTNSVHVDVSVLDGTGTATAEDSVTIAIGGTSQPARTTMDGGWEPPDEFGLNMSIEGLVL